MEKLTVCASLTVFMFLFIILQLYGNVDPYMDEIYHYPQGLAYCRNKFYTWDPKITTFPGLYIISYIFKMFTILPLTLFGINDENNNVSCSIIYYRGHNIVLATLSLILYFKCRSKLHPLLEMKFKNWLIATILFLYPLNFFYYFMYYTDTSSTFFLLLVYYLSMILHHEYKMKNVSNITYGLLLISTFIAACMAILMRQTNAIWMLFIAGTFVIDDLKRRSNYQDTWANFNIKGIIELISMFIQDAKQLIYDALPLLLPVFLFIMFIYYNGSIVLGDKENHEVSTHLAMPLHMLFIVSIIMDPMNIFNEFKNILYTGSNTTLGSLCKHSIGLCVIFCMLYYGSYDHPFLLSDNRHYMFYIWKRILCHNVVRMFLSPIYYIAINSYLSKVANTKGPMWVLMYLVCVFLNLVPARLLEPRYFTPGIIIASLNTSLDPIYSFKKGFVLSTSYVLLISIFILFNVISIKVFLYNSFQTNEGEIARFMY